MANTNIQLSSTASQSYGPKIVRTIERWQRKPRPRCPRSTPREEQLYGTFETTAKKNVFEWEETLDWELKTFGWLQRNFTNTQNFDVDREAWLNVIGMAVDYVLEGWSFHSFPSTTDL